MAIVRLKRKKQESPIGYEQEQSPEENASLLQQLGSGALSTMHTVGSVLSAPSRWTWGTINGLAGGEGGYGNMSLTDSTGGVELSHVLGNMGLLQKNDPNSWEWMDPVRGLVDIAGDPTTYLNPLPLTAKGLGLIKGAGKAAPKIAGEAAEAASEAVARSADDLASPVAEEVANASRWADDGIYKNAAEAQAAAQSIRGMPLHEDLGGLYGSVRGTGDNIHTGPIPDDGLLGMANVPKKGYSYEDLVKVAERGDPEEIAYFQKQGLLGNGLGDLLDAYKAKQSPSMDDVFRTADSTLEPAAPVFNRAQYPPATAIQPQEILAAGMNPLHDMPLVEQIRQGYRGVGGIQLPFMKPLTTGATGPAVAALAEKTYIPQALDYIGRSAVMRGVRAKLDWRTRNVFDEDLQPHIMKASEQKSTLDQASTRDAIYDLEDRIRLGINSPEMVRQSRMANEGVDPKYASIDGTYNDDVLKVSSRVRAENQRRGGFGERFGFFNKHVDEAGIEHAPRSINPNYGKSAGGVKDRAVQFRGHKKGTEGVEEILTDRKILKKIEEDIAGGQSKEKSIRAISGYIRRVYGKGMKDRHGRLRGPALDVYQERYVSSKSGKSKSRTLKMAKYLYEHPDVMKHGLFTNDPIHDTLQYNLKNNFLQTHVPAILDAAAAHIKRGAGEAAKKTGRHGTAEDLIKITRMKKRSGAQFVDEMARRTGLPAAKIKSLPLSEGFIENAKRAMSSPLQQAAVPEVSGFFKSLMTAWKARTLAHPSTRARDYLSALMQNKLMKHSSPIGDSEAKAILGGGQLTGYADDPLVEMSLRRAGAEATPETETMAMRAALGAGHPVQHGVVGDLPEASYGVTAEDMLVNSPGHSPRSWGRFGSDVKQIASGKTFNPASQEWQPTRWRDMLNPFAVRGAFGYEKSLNPRYVLSEYLAHHGDTSTRLASTLGQADQGLPLAEAIRRTNSSLVDYNPETFSNFERNLKMYGVPFYGFSSRMAKHTAGELATNPGGLTAQMVKASGRASQGDPSVPDEVNSSASIPFRWPWVQDDGSKNFMAGFGFMHEDPINKFGALLRGDAPGLFKSVGGMVGPLFKPAIELGTGVSLFNGEEIDSLDPSLGRTLSNLGVMTGLRPDGTRPVDMGDRGWTDRLIGYSPFGRDANTIRMLTDVRPSKSVLDKALQLSTGYRTTSITPERQQKILRKRLEKAAKGLGAREISNVSFSPEQMDAIKARDPQTAENLQKLQRIIRSMQRRNTAKKKEKSK